MNLNGCLEGDSQESVNKGDKGCPYSNYISNVTVHYEHYRTLPKFLSGTVNGVPLFNECTKGGITEDYALVKTGTNEATLAIQMRKGSTMHEQYFTDDDHPKSKPWIQVTIYGQDDCRTSASQLQQISRSVAWQPVYLSGGSCGADGYSAVVK